MRRTRWYDRSRWPYGVDGGTAQHYADWLRPIPWAVFGTFTFAWEVSDPQADRIFVEFINRLEQLLGCDVCYVRGDEKRLSGCGKPASGRHFHVVMASVAQLDCRIIADLWTSMAGHREGGAGAHVEPYDSHLDSIAYAWKFIHEIDGDWNFRKLPSVLARRRTPNQLPNA
jgi:hypothetical protein